MVMLDINAIRDYLLEVGCKIEYQILVHAFKKHLYNEDPEVQGRIRTQFKDYVNRLATVSLENNTKFIILRPEFKPTNHVSLVQSSTNNHQQQQNLFADQGKSSELVKISRQQTQHVGPPINIEQISPTRVAAQRHQPPPVPEHRTNQQVLEAQHSSTVFFPQQQTQQQQPSQIMLQSQQQQYTTPTMTAPRRRREQPPIPQLSQQIPQCQEYNDIELHHHHHHHHHHHQQQQQQHQLPNLTLSSPKVQPQVQSAVSVKLVKANSMETNNCHRKTHSDVKDGMLPPPTPPPIAQRSIHLLQRPESLNLTSSSCPPPRPPPRRRQSTASLFKPTIITSHQSTIEKSQEIHDLAKKSPGRVKEHALKLNSFTSSNDLSALTPIRNNIMKENNRLSRDPSIAGSLASALQRNGSHLTNRSRSSHREDESDSSSLQPIDPLRRKWSIEACNCNYNGLLTLLREDPKLAHYKDIVNGYTALHWAAKFGNLDIIKLIAGNHSVSANIKSSAGYTPLHIARMFNRNEAADLLLKSYKANPNIRDHSGKRPAQYSKTVTSNC